MTRQANLAQVPRLDQLTSTDARFVDGEHLTLTLPRLAWEAMGRPVDLQVVMSPLGQHEAAIGRTLLAQGEPAPGTPADYREMVPGEIDLTKDGKADA